MASSDSAASSRVSRLAVATVESVGLALRRAGFTVLGVLLAALWLWTLMALAVYEPWPRLMRLPLVALWLAMIPTLWVTLRARIQPREFAWIPLTLLVVGGALFVRFLWAFWLPSNDRDWAPEQARVPIATFSGTSVTIENVRNFTHRGTDDFDERWETRTYDLREIQTVEMCIVPFAWDRRLLAHTFLTFGFSGGEYVAISVEARKEAGEPYRTLLGAFRQHELMYVVADERDVIGLRTNIWSVPFYLYPMDVEPALVEALFVTMLTRANRLRDHPEWYNLVTNSCSSNMINHLRDLYQAKARFSPGALVPGYLDHLAAEIGLLRIDGPLEQVRDRHLVTDRDLVVQPGRNWSLQIRGLDAAPGLLASPEHN
jgi:hypothetical protein